MPVKRTVQLVVALELAQVQQIVVVEAQVQQEPQRKLVQLATVGR